MAQPPLSPEELERRLKAIADADGDISKAARELKLPRATLNNTVNMAAVKGIEIPVLAARQRLSRGEINKLSRPGAYFVLNYPGRIDLEIENGVVLVGSDAHIWPGEPTIAMKAFEAAITHFRPELKAVILNGDSLDGAKVSRYPSIGWEKKPTLAEELAAVQKQKRRLQQLGGPDARYIWPLGNHDARFESSVANRLPEFQHIQGVHLRDHFESWECCWSVFINDELVVKHRFKGGIHATWNNTMYAGKSIATGHLHSLRATPFTDYDGTRWGVDTGMLATPYSEPFIHYTEGSPVNWRAGFVVFTFVDGAMLQPELVIVRDATSWEFRGRIYRDTHAEWRALNEGLK